MYKTQPLLTQGCYLIIWTLCEIMSPTALIIFCNTFLPLDLGLIQSHASRTSIPSCLLLWLQHLNLTAGAQKIPRRLGIALKGHRQHFIYTFKVLMFTSPSIFSHVAPIRIIFLLGTVSDHKSLRRGNLAGKGLSLHPQVAYLHLSQYGI